MGVTLTALGILLGVRLLSSSGRSAPVSPRRYAGVLEVRVAGLVLPRLDDVNEQGGGDSQ
jgi:hypothetical protein